MAHPQIAVFARLAEENSVPLRVIAGQKTLLSRTMHDIRYDAIHDEIVVSNPFAQAILTFRGSATGEEAPIRVIQGPKTMIGNVDRVGIDPANNEIYVPIRESVLVFPRTGTGDIVPARVIRGPDTTLTRARSVGVDPVRNVVAVAVDGDRSTQRGGQPGEGKLPSIVIFSRTASGNVKPLRVIEGPRTEIVRFSQIQVYPPKGWVIITQPGRVDVQEPEDVFVGIWSIEDNGDVPPRWKIGGERSGMKKPRGVVLNPKNKELIVADMRLNSVLTYYFPEIF